MPRFVLLHHVVPADAPRPSHCDLMLEAGDVLRTWSLIALPRDWATCDTESLLSFADKNDVDAEQLPDHRLEYLDYEGAISGERGYVRRLDTGEFELESETKETIVAALAGTHVRGQIIIRSKNATHKRFSIQFVRR